MAELECEALRSGVANVNQYIASAINRSVDAIACRRRRGDYRELLETMRNEVVRTPNSDDDMPETNTRNLVRLRTPWTIEERNVVESGQDLDTLRRLLPTRSVEAIRTLRRRIRYDANRGISNSVDSDSDTGVDSPPQAAEQANNALLGAFSDSDGFGLKIRAIIGGSSSIDLEYYDLLQITPRQNTRRRARCADPRLRTDLRSRRQQKKQVHLFIQRVWRKSPKNAVI